MANGFNNKFGFMKQKTSVNIIILDLKPWVSVVVLAVQTSKKF